MSLLLSEGHAHARRYPVVMVWGEAILVRERFAQAETTRAVLTQAAIISVLDKQGGKHFSKMLELLRG